MEAALLMFLALIGGSLVTLQSVLNASLGRHVGSLGAVLVVAVLGMVIILAAVLLFLQRADLRALPGPGLWYLYLGGALGIVIVAIPVFLVPRIGSRQPSRGSLARCCSGQGPISSCVTSHPLPAHPAEPWFSASSVAQEGGSRRQKSCPYE